MVKLLKFHNCLSILTICKLAEGLNNDISQVFVISLQRTRHAGQPAEPPVEERLHQLEMRLSVVNPRGFHRIQAIKIHGGLLCQPFRASLIVNEK